MKIARSKLTEEKGVPQRLNTLAREQMKKKLLTDILVDLTICDLEGWDKKEYLNDLKKTINSLIKYD